MFSPNEQQIEICLLKSNLEEIENHLVTQRSLLPNLDKDNEQKYSETITALRVARSLNSETERLKQENARLTAKRTQLQRQCEEIRHTLENSREKRDELTESLKQEESEIEQLIRQYEDSLQEKADRFRQTRGFYNEEETNIAIEKINYTIAELEVELARRQSHVDNLKGQLYAIHPDVPEDLLALVGKTELIAKTKEVTEHYESLVEKRNILLDQKSKASETFGKKF